MFLFFGVIIIFSRVLGKKSEEKIVQDWKSILKPKIDKGSRVGLVETAAGLRSSHHHQKTFFLQFIRMTGFPSYIPLLFIIYFFLCPTLMNSPTPNSCLLDSFSSSAFHRRISLIPMNGTNPCTLYVIHSMSAYQYIFTIFTGNFESAVLPSISSNLKSNCKLSLKN